MKIATIEAIPIGIPFTHPGPPMMFLGKPRMVYECALIRVETESGLVGWGETHMAVWRPIQALIEDWIGPAVVGRDASDIQSLMRQLRQIFYPMGGGAGIAMFALSALDIALWDIAGKAAGLPLYRLLGGSAREAAATYASLAFFRGPDVVAAATSAVVGAGFRRIKLHSIAPDEVRAAREAAGADVELMVDASTKWSPLEARQAARALESYGISWLEDPIYPPTSFAALARLRSETSIPIAAGEYVGSGAEFEAMLSAGAVDIATPCVNKIGGVTEFRKASAIAEAHGVELTAQANCHGPALLATLHVMAAQPGRALVEKMFVTLEAPLAGFPVAPKEGQYRAPDAPGLGHDPDPDLVREYRLRPR